MNKTKNSLNDSVPNDNTPKGELIDSEVVDKTTETNIKARSKDMCSEFVEDSDMDDSDNQYDIDGNQEYLDDDSMQDFEDDDEPETVGRKVQMPIKALAIGIVMFFITVFIGSSLMFIYTPILSKLKLPIYGGYISRDVLVESLIKMDSIKYELDVWRHYNQNITDIMAGDKPSLKIDTVTDIANMENEVEIHVSSHEDILRKKVSSDRRYEKTEILYEYNFYPPLQGEIEISFDKNPNKEIVISVYESKEVLAINDGTVIASYWDVKNGNVINIQHSDNMISTYSSLSQTSKKVGDKVLAGEVIGYIGGGETKDKQNDTSLDKHTLNFGLWHNGNKVNPVNYIVF